MDDDTEIDIELLEYPANAPLEEQRRAYVFAQLAALEYEHNIKIEEAQAWLVWIQDGTVPVKKRERKLAVVDK